MAWTILRPQIKEILDTIDTIQEVSKAPKIKFGGYPAAHVVPSDNTGDYETNKENIRTYAFIVRLFYETKTSGIENSIAALEEVVDSVIDRFDEEDLKGSDTRKVGVNLPEKYTYLNVWASPGRWSEVPEDELIMTEVVVRVRISVDITS